MNPYNVKISEGKIRRPLISLDVLYNGMPETTGCEKCKEKNGDDAYWCCRTISPSMYYVEFLKVWLEVQKWSKKNKAALFIRAITNYLDTGQNKGCIFWDEKCLVYKDRPFQCRLYGVIPQDSWDSRIKSIEERDKDFEYRPQCNMVSVVGDKEITSQDEDKWFEHIKQCEKDIGIPNSIVKLHDIPGGSYRTFHDHLLLEVLEIPAMNELTKVKMSKPSKADIKAFAEILAEKLSGKLHGCHLRRIHE